MKKHGMNTQPPDHDDFHGEAMAILRRTFGISPSFDRLPRPAKDLTSRTANLAHYGHLVHLECDSRGLDQLAESGIVKNDPIAFLFNYCSYICDVSGALGHVNGESSKVYNEATHRNVKLVYDTLLELSTLSADEVYDLLVARKAKQVFGSSPKDSFEYVLTRFAAMLRFSNADDADLLKSIALKFSPEDREKIIKAFVKLPIDFTYLPAVLVNLANNPLLGSTREERISTGFLMGIPFAAEVILAYHEGLATGVKPKLKLCFNPIAGVAKSKDFQLLSQKRFSIRDDGDVVIE